MSAVLPPSGSTAPASAGAAVPVQVAVSGDAAKALAALPIGTMIDAQAQIRAAKGVLEVMTLDGPLTLKVQPPATLPPIPEGARLALQVGPNGGLTLMGVNGRALGGGPLMGQGVLAGLSLPPILTGGAAAGTATPNGGGPQGAPTPALATPDGAVKATPAALGLTATVIRPAQTPPPNATPATDQTLSPSLPPGTQITVRIAGILPPQTVLSPGVSAAAPSLPGAPPPLGPTPTAPPAGPVPATMPGQPAPLPGQPGISLAPAPPQGGAGHSLTGTVSAHPPGGQAVLSTPIGAVALPSAEALPVGSVVKLDVMGPPQLPAATAPARSDGLSPQGWPALSETLDSLSNPADRQALDTLMRVIPQSGPRLAAAMVAFGGLMRSGEARGALTDGIGKALDRAGKRDLAERLKSDLADLADDQGRVVGNGDWRLHTMPFAHGGQVDPIHLFVRAPSGDDQRHQVGTRDGDQRFILDFNLTNLGRLQMDGLVRREDKLFDLIIRTDQPLAQQIRMDIMAIFTQAAELVGTKGSVAFQSGGRWVDIPTHPTGPTSIQA